MAASAIPGFLVLFVFSSVSSFPVWNGRELPARSAATPAAPSASLPPPSPPRLLSSFLFFLPTATHVPLLGLPPEVDP